MISKILAQSVCTVSWRCWSEAIKANKTPLLLTFWILFFFHLQPYLFFPFLIQLFDFQSNSSIFLAIFNSSDHFRFFNACVMSRLPLYDDKAAFTAGLQASGANLSGKGDDIFRESRENLAVSRLDTNSNLSWPVKTSYLDCPLLPPLTLPLLLALKTKQLSSLFALVWWLVAPLLQ